MDELYIPATLIKRRHRGPMYRVADLIDSVAISTAHPVGYFENMYEDNDSTKGSNDDLGPYVTW